jgi:DNA invertase Pin-like site-specific DNA recombinase
MSKRRSAKSVDTRPPICISYLRFSTPEQARGDSLRRQTEETERWCERNGIPLDQSISDQGRSAYHGRHRDDKAALGRFLELARSGGISRGSFLIIENLDRLSREDERTALRLWLDILDAGVNIVQLWPETIFNHERSDMTDIIRAIIELSRGHSESVAKAKRAEANWQKRYKAARERGERLTAWLPAWIRPLSSDAGALGFELIPDRAETVRRIFELARSGYGQGAIAKKLREGKVPAFGPTGKWSTEYVRRILSDRRAVGELQPKRGKDRKADGEPIRGYYPAVVGEQEWRLARAAIHGRRRNKVGRLGGDGVANLFGGMLVNARGGIGRDGKPADTYIAAMRTDGGRRVRVVMAGSFFNQEGPCYSFPLDSLERAILLCLEEIKPEEVLPSETNGHLADLEGELGMVQAKIAELAAELVRGDSATIANVVRQLEARETELVRQRDEASDRSVLPLGSSWNDMRKLTRTLATLLDEAEDSAALADVRVRLRSAIRRIIEQVWLLVIPRGRNRLCVVQLFFMGGKRRDYLVLHRSGRGNASAKTPSSWEVVSLKDAARVEPDGIDLRDARQVAELLADLETTELD